MRLSGMTLSVVGTLLVAFSIQLATAQQLTVAMSAQPETLDPHLTSATSSFQVTKSLYDTLVEVNRQGEIVPALAESWQVSDDGLSWTFVLREGVRFHDGTVLDSGDVVATIERVLDEATAAPKRPEFAAIVSLMAPDPLTVVLTLAVPAPAIVATLASGWGAILPAEKVAAGHDFGNSPVGTGPFRLERWARDSHLELVRFEDYYQGAPELERVSLRFVPDRAVQLQGLLIGEFDVVSAIAPDDIPTIAANHEVVLVEELSGMVLVAALNNRRPYLNDPRVRRALNYAVDKETMLEVAYGGGEVVGTFMEASSPWKPETIKPFPFDPERARQLLAEAGVPANWRLDLVLPQPFEVHIQAGQILQAMLAEVGVATDIRIVEWGVWLAEVFRGPRNFDITVIGHTGKLDPTGRFLVGATGDPEETYTGYQNARVVALLEQAARTSDLEARRTLYGEVFTYLHQEAPFIYFGTPYRRYAHRTNVEGFWLTPLLDTFDFREVRITN